MSRAPQDIILTPVITEKSAGIIEDGKYTFKVAVDANKTEIKLAVEKLFGVKVTGVNITNYITINNSDDPEGVAKTIIRNMKLEMRTV